MTKSDVIARIESLEASYQDRNNDLEKSFEDGGYTLSQDQGAADDCVSIRTEIDHLQKIMAAIEADPVDLAEVAKLVIQYATMPQYGR